MKTDKKDTRAVEGRQIVLALDPMAVQLYNEEEERAALVKAAKGGDKDAKSRLGGMQEPLHMIAEALTKHSRGEKSGPVRMAFESDPSTTTGVYDSLYKAKLQLIPDVLIKKVCRQDDLIAAVLNARSNQVSAFGRPQASRFDVGFDLIPLPGVLKDLESDEDAKEKFQDSIDKAKKVLFHCGLTEGWDDSERLNFPEFFKMLTHDGLRFGRGAVEIVSVPNEEGEPEFHSFRNVDAGTIYKVADRSKTQAGALRAQAKKLLEQLKGERLKYEKFFPDKDNEDEGYAWVQVIEGRPVQAFTHDELYVHNFYPATDVEYNGYPLTPLDTIITAVTTHINISLHNKLYFQSGRATRGMIIVKAEGVDQAALQQIRIQFNASVNSVVNAWRMPVFGVGPEDSIEWVPVESSVARDAEFQFLSDSNARTILSAFQMSPEELPGYAHLSRGTNSQALSEGNNEYKLEAARDVGIRPLIMSVQDFVNDRILPLIAPDLKGKVCFSMVGLDAEDPEKEAVRLGQDMPLHMTYNDVLQKVEKDPVEKEFGGDFPLNPQFQVVLDKYLTVGEILARFFGREDAKDDKNLAYVRDPFWFQWQQIALQREQMALQAAQAAAAAGQPQPGDGQDGEDRPPQEGDLSASVDMLAQTVGLTKSERQLSPDRRRLLAMHRAVVDRAMKNWESESKRAMGEIAQVAAKHKGRGKKAQVA